MKVDELFDTASINSNSHKTKEITVKRYLFNPELDAPLKYIHPLQRNAIKALIDSDIPKSVEQIILFGSSLELAISPNSDIDLFVITDDDKETIYEQMYRICRELGRPFDILVSSKDEFFEESALLGTVEKDILENGEIIYETEKNNTPR